MLTCNCRKCNFFLNHTINNIFVIINHFHLFVLFENHRVHNHQTKTTCHITKCRLFCIIDCTCFNGLSTQIKYMVFKFCHTHNCLCNIHQFSFPNLIIISGNLVSDQRHRVSTRQLFCKVLRLKCFHSLNQHTSLLVTADLNRCVVRHTIIIQSFHVIFKRIQWFVNRNSGNITFFTNQIHD